MQRLEVCSAVRQTDSGHIPNDFIPFFSYLTRFSKWADLIPTNLSNKNLKVLKCIALTFQKIFTKICMI